MRSNDRVRHGVVHILFTIWVLTNHLFCGIIYTQKERKEVLIMEQTYRLTVRSCESKPHIEATFINIPQDRIRRLMDFAPRAFRDVEITAEETGEIIFTCYRDCDWFVPVLNYGDAIDTITCVCYKE